MEKVLAIKDEEGLCWKCLKVHNKDQIHVIDIPEMGYGGAFDGCGTELHLCDKCYQESVEEHDGIWGMDELTEGIFESYVHEKEMVDYINNMPLQGQQLLWNEFAHGFFADTMEPQDWIDTMQDINEHENDCTEDTLDRDQDDFDDTFYNVQDRIATALERIADSLDEMLRSGLPVRE